VSGIAAVGSPRATILLTGIILIFVEAFSMSVGSLLSDNSAKEFEHKSNVALSRSFSGSVVMFFSYFLSGFIVIVPYIVLPPDTALPASIILSLVALFGLGIMSAYISRTSIIRKGITMMVIGGIAILVGIVVGLFVQGI